MVIWNRVKLKKRGTFAAKIIVMVILAVIVSNVICMVFILESSKKQITDSVKHTMVDVVNTTSKIMENEISNSGVDDLDYDGYANNLLDVSLKAWTVHTCMWFKMMAQCFIILQRKRLDSLLRML